MNITGGIFGAFAGFTRCPCEREMRRGVEQIHFGKCSQTCSGRHIFHSLHMYAPNGSSNGDQLTAIYPWGYLTIIPTTLGQERSNTGGTHCKLLRRIQSRWRKFNELGIYWADLCAVTMILHHCCSPMMCIRPSMISFEAILSDVAV